MHLRRNSKSKRAGFTLVEVLCACLVGVMGMLTVLTLMHAVKDKAVWVICHDAAVAAVAEDINDALSTDLRSLNSSSNQVNLYFTTDALRDKEGIRGEFRRFVSFPEGTNSYAIVRSQVIWFYGPYHGNYTNWLVTYVFP